MLDWLKSLKEKPGIAHLLRANERFGGRLGDQFGAAITYFSVLAMVPIIMFAFSITGFVLVELRPELLDVVEGKIGEAIGGGGSTEQIMEVISNALRNYRAIGIIGLLSAMYSGAGWAGNLKNAVRAQWREEFDLQIVKENFFVKTLKNLAILVGLLIAVALTFGVASVSTSLSGAIVGWLGLDDLTWLKPVLQFVPLLVSVGAGWLLFMYLYLVLPETRAPWSAVRRGALIGAVGLAVLQYLTSFLIGKFAGNPAAALFGPVIALMLFFNLFARLILFIAAWISTADSPAFVVQERSRRKQQKAYAKGKGPKPEAAEPEAVAGAPEALQGAEPEATTAAAYPDTVPQKVAVRSVRAGMGAGYVTGAATGVGIGAAIASLAAWINRRRGRS